MSIGLVKTIKDKIKTTTHSLLQSDDHSKHVEEIKAAFHSKSNSLDSLNAAELVEYTDRTNTKVLYDAPQVDKKHAVKGEGFSEGDSGISSQNEMYEQQLTQLQDQLVNTMIDNQNLASELKTLKESNALKQMKSELEYEKKKNAELVQKITQITQQGINDTRRRNDSSSQIKDSTPQEAAGLKTVENMGWFDRFSLALLDKFYDVIDDFSVTNESVEQPVSVEPLSVKKLRDNVKRFSNAVDPIFETLSGFKMLFMWQYPLLTCSVFLMWMYMSWKGLLVPGLLFFLVMRFILNLLQEWKLINEIRLLPYKVKEMTEEKETSVSDKFNIVLQVATKVQNTLGDLADNLEKLYNLLMWRQVDLTKQIFLPVCVAFITSCFLSLDALVMVAGLALGVKIFLIDPVYTRFPRVREKYDKTAQLWQSLKTQEQLEHQRQLEANTQASLASTAGSVQNTTRLSADDMTEEDKEFCKKFRLPNEEKPDRSSAFKVGKHCVHLEKDETLSVKTAFTNHAKIYLTKSFLCYELVHGEEFKAIPLASITRVDKKKVLLFLPGGGLALEVFVQGFEKSHIFGGLIGRDECYENLIERGRVLDCPYIQNTPELKTDLRLSDLGDDTVNIGMDQFS